MNKIKKINQGTENTKKRICFVTTISLTMRTFILELAVFLHEKKGWDVSFICDYDEEFVTSLPEYIHYFPVPMKRGINFSFINASRQMYSIFKREKFDIIQYSTPNASFCASIAGWISKIPVRLYCQWGIAYVGFSGVIRFILKGIEKMICSISTHIEPDSNSNLQFAFNEKLYDEKKGCVIWNGSACGIDMKKFDYLKKEEYNLAIRKEYDISLHGFVFGYVGRITKDKGINELLHSFKMIDDENVYLILVGPKECDDSVNSELYDWSLKKKNIIYVGYTSEVEKYLSCMNCYILPSYREGFGMGIIEAEAMGIPVIVSDIPGPIDAMQNYKTGITVKRADITSLYDAMVLLMNNCDLCVEMGEKGREYVERCFERQRLFEYIAQDRTMLINAKNRGC